jgi:hypothetical protein
VRDSSNRVEGRRLRRLPLPPEEDISEQLRFLDSSGRLPPRLSAIAGSGSVTGQPYGRLNPGDPLSEAALVSMDGDAEGRREVVRFRGVISWDGRDGYIPPSRLGILLREHDTGPPSSGVALKPVAKYPTRRDWFHLLGGLAGGATLTNAADSSAAKGLLEMVTASFKRRSGSLAFCGPEEATDGFLRERIYNALLSQANDSARDAAAAEQERGDRIQQIVATACRFRSGWVPPFRTSGSHLSGCGAIRLIAPFICGRSSSRPACLAPAPKVRSETTG